MDEDLKDRYDRLRNAEPFSEESLAEGLSKKVKVLARLEEAIEAFSS